MNAAEQNRQSRLFERIPQAVAMVVVAAGMLVLMGWLFDLDVLKTMLPGLTAMKVNTAVGFILSGISLWGIQVSAQGMPLRIVSQACAGAVLLLGLLTLGEYLSGADFGIDQLLIQDITTLPGDIPGRMAANTMLSFAALGAALLLLSLGKGDLVVAIHALAMVPVVAAGSALIGYAFDIGEFLRVKLDYTPMAANTAAAFVLLAMGIVNARPNYPFRRFMTSDSAAGITVRRLLPAAIVFTLAAGWLILQGYHAGYFSAVFALALFTAASIAGLSALILWNAEMLYEAAVQRERTEERNRHLAAIVESSDDAIIGKTLDGIITSWNKGAEKMYGYSATEAVGQPMSILIPPNHQDELPRIMETIMVGRHVEHFETVRRRKNGEHIHVALSVSPISEAGGRIIGAATVARDITERKQAGEERLAALIYARSLIDASLDPLVTISPEGKVTDVNQATENATGLSRRELIGTDFSNYFTEPEKARAGYQQVLSEGSVIDYALTLRHVSGRMIEVLYNASVYRNEKGEVAGVFAAARDITERKRAEEELRKSHEHLEELVRERTAALEIANKDLESFAYSVSHDLRTPLRAIDGFSLQVLKRYENKLDEEGRRYLNVVRDNTKKMSQLIDDILAFSRMGRLGMTMSDINMEELAHAVFEDLKPSLAGRELTMEIKPLPRCHGDLSMLRQVLVNLLGNAIKFTRHREAALVEVGGGIEGAENIYYVKDNGAGFDMQYAEKLFGVFQRLHGVEEFEGTGIGLAIIKRIIIRHGGRVWAEGRVDEGATIYFALPTKENT